MSVSCCRSICPQFLFVDWLENVMGEGCCGLTALAGRAPSEHGDARRRIFLNP